MWYNACVVLTGAIRKTFRDKIYQGLDVKSL